MAGDFEATQRQQQVLQRARSLDAIGRRTEEFLCEQLDQLERAIEEFESEKSAWRRQYLRESQELARQRDEVERLMDSHVSEASGIRYSSAVTGRMKKASAETDARFSGVDPLRLLIQPGKASAMQVGLLMFEISKLNRDMGGRGLRFEIDDVRIPKRGLLARITGSEASEQILELTVFPAVPLSARGTHVAFDVDLTDRLEDWITFKSHLLQTSLVNTSLIEVFRNSRSAKDEQQPNNAVKEAVRNAESKRSAQSHQTDSSSTAFWAVSSIDAIRQQMARVDNCYERLSIESGLFMHVEIHPQHGENSVIRVHADSGEQRCDTSVKLNDSFRAGYRAVGE